MKDNVSYIYLLETNLGYHKIGFAKDVFKRLKAFEVKLPFEVSLLSSIEVELSKVRYYESWLHQFFADKRIRGEWFVLDYFSLKMFVEYLDTQDDLDYLIQYAEESLPFSDLRDFGISRSMECMTELSLRRDKQSNVISDPF